MVMPNKLLGYFLCGLYIGAALLLSPQVSLADIQDPLDPFDTASQYETPGEQDDNNKSVQDLILESTLLLQDQRPLDARTKLLKALQKDPNAFEAHTLLAGYYMVHVGHFRLALKYVKRAMDLFAEKNGPAPYSEYRLSSQHAHLLYLLSQVRLNLDDYQGSLAVLDEFTARGYSAEWYSGTRAWVLMKMGNLDEAIRMARLGVLAGSEPGRSLNMLGILLSMHGEREASISVFRDAISQELSLGTLGQPATPLNNVGEVYKEIFLEDKAESSWIRATSMPDGCEHVLPSLNLALLYIDQLNFNAAERTIANFESCIAQFPLRNGEEHRALVDLARGRIALHTGRAEQAIHLIERALQNRQWFGKIGTNQADLEAGALMSYAAALKAHNAHLGYKLYDDTKEWLESLKLRSLNYLRSCWLMRRARQILTEDLEDFEDIYIRNTDSLLEYPTLGAVLNGIPTNVLMHRLSYEEGSDNRKEAALFYKAYLGENLLHNGDQTTGLKLLNEVINTSRQKFDNLLRLHTILNTMTVLDSASEDYATLAAQAFNLARASLRNAGLRLPVNYSEGDTEIFKRLRKSAFILDNSRSLQYSIEYDNWAGEITLKFRSSTPGMVDIQVRGNNLSDAINQLTEEVFTQDIK